MPPNKFGLQLKRSTADRLISPIEGDGRVSQPTLVILAENDRFIPAARTKASLRFLEQGRLLSMGSGTHWVASEEPERIGTVLVDFLSDPGN